MTQVSIIAVRALVAAAEGTGVSRERILAEAGFAATRLDDTHARIALGDYDRIVHAVLSTSGDPALGLHLGEHPTPSRFDVLGHLCEHSKCLREALQRIMQYSRIVVDGPRVELLEEGDVATVLVTQLDDESPRVRLAAEYAMSGLLYLFRRFVGPAVQVRRAFFAYEAPAHNAEYSRIFGDVRFSHAFTGLEVDRAWLDRAQLTHSPELSQLLQSRAERLLARVAQDLPAAERVKRWLASQSQQSKPRMDAVAVDLGMSARSLRRRLREERADYNALVNEARATHAKRMLADRHKSIQEIAYAMEFRSPAAFSQAFKKWTGMAPSAYRDTH